MTVTLVDHRATKRANGIHGLTNDRTLKKSCTPTRGHGAVPGDRRGLRLVEEGGEKPRSANKYDFFGEIARDWAR